MTALLQAYTTEVILTVAVALVIAVGIGFLIGRVLGRR